MRCDYCRREDAVLERDSRGRATEAICPGCKEAYRIALTRPLIDQFGDHLNKILPTETVH